MTRPFCDVIYMKESIIFLCQLTIRILVLHVFVRKVLKEISVGDLKPNETVEANLEAQLLSKLDHPAIVKFYASFVELDSFCIITEYCEGGDLDYKIQEYKESGKLFAQRQIIEWFIQLLLGVNYMHERRILHRDLKTKNIFLKNNLLKIGDFGVSCLLMGSCDLATTFTGTPYYMSPEALKHQGYNTKSDICMLNKNPSQRPAAGEILKIPYIDEQLKNIHYNFTCMTVKDRGLNWQKEAAPIVDAVQRKVHLQTLQELSEVQKMTPRERMRLRKLNAADEKAKKLKQLAEEKYRENIKRMQEFRSHNFQKLNVNVLHVSRGCWGPCLRTFSVYVFSVCHTLSLALEALSYSEINYLDVHRSLDPLTEPCGPVMKIPEDPEIAEEYYNDEFESCSEDSEAEEDVEVSRTVSNANHQDSDIEAMVKHLESVLNNSSLDFAILNHIPKTQQQASELERSAIQKLGGEVFGKVYTYLKQARQQKASEEEITRHLEKLVPRASDCFEVDQLLYFEEQLQDSESCLQL
ncbi:UNVERIFIED_CONTAM: hypothetical protein H355_002038 [Colinus virginianus]|nr:hypothetical protein H355_002038 [Colinus virginianus]